MYAVGELTKGHFFFTASMTKLAEQTHTLTTQISERLLEKHT